MGDTGDDDKYGIFDTASNSANNIHPVINKPGSFRKLATGRDLTSSPRGGATPSSPAKNPLKRSVPDSSDGLPTKKKVKQSGGNTMLQKYAVQQLNELKPDLQFVFVSQTGPTHQPTFTISVELNGEVL